MAIVNATGITGTDWKSYIFSINNSNPLKFTSSTAVNLLYKVYLYDTATSAYVVKTGFIQQPPKVGTTNEFWIDISNIIRNYYDDTKLQTGINQTNIVEEQEVALTAKLELWEETLSGGLLVNNVSADATITNILFINSAIQNQYMDSTIYYSNLDSFELITGRTKRFLTNRPMGVRVFEDDKFNLSLLHNGGVDYTGLKVKSDIDGTTFVISSSFDANGIATNNELVAIRCGYSNNDLGGFPTSPNTYNIYATDSSDNVLTEKMSFNVRKAKCGSASEIFRLQWINPYGVYDFYSFVGSYEQSLNTSFSTYTRQRGYKYNATEGHADNTDRTDRHTIMKTNIEGTTEYTITTDLVTYNVARWLSEIALSPKVWRVQHEGEGNSYSAFAQGGDWSTSVSTGDTGHNWCMPLICTSTKISYKEPNTKLIKLEIKLKESKGIVTQV